jgi:hypothetical protein
MVEHVRYSDQMTLSVPPGFRSQLDEAGRRAGIKGTEWTRQRLTEALRAAGIDPATIRPQDAGGLYNALPDGQRQSTSAVTQQSQTSQWVK